MLLTTAHKQWASRPADERVPDLKTLFERAKEQFKACVEKEAKFADLRVEAENDEIVLTRGGAKAELTNWSFGQLCNRVGAPASYLAELPTTLAVQNLNCGLKQKSEREEGREDASLLFEKNGSWKLRALTTDAYERIWNYEVAERILELQAKGWEPARPDFNKSHDDFPSLYLGDRDMFAFIRQPNMTIEQPVKSKMGDSAPIYKGVIYENSEVGSKKIRATKFFYNGMCGNHCIWGATDVMEFEARHVGNVRNKVALFNMQIRKYAEESMTSDEQKFKAAAKKVLAGTKDEVLDLLFGKRSLGLSRKVLDAGYDAVVREQDGAPNTVWGMVQGLTRYSQTIPYADERTRVDRAAGKILDLAF